MIQRHTFIISLILTLAIGVGSGIIYEGKHLSQKNSNKNQILVNRFENEPDGIDFGLFWDVWDIIQNQYVDRSDLDSQTLVYGAIEGLLGSLDDPYTVFFPPKENEAFNESIKGEFAGVGIEIGIRQKNLTVISPIQGTPGEQAGIRALDTITAIDGKSTDGIALHEAVEQIRGKRGTNVVLTIYRKSFDSPKDFTIARDTIKIPAARLTILDNEKYNIGPEEKIGHLQIFTFNQNVDKEFKEAADKATDRGVTRLILDLRNNPGGLLDSSINIASYFIDPDNDVVIERFGNGSENIFKSTRNGQLKDMKLIILINGGSASASEILAGALRDQKNVVIVGEQSFGKGSVQQVNDLKGKTSIKVTIAKWLTPNGISINENGLAPDLEIERTVDDINNNLDPQLDKAVELIKQQ